MKKFYLVLLLALCLCAAGITAVIAEETTPVTADELAEWAGMLKERALEAVPENDPSDESADVEGGILFRYAFADIYADRTEMTADTYLSAIVLFETEDVAFRNVSLSMTPDELTALFPDDNPEQAGDRDGALLYMAEPEEGGLLFGRVYRDGQRVSSVQYGHLVPTEGGYRPAVISFLFSSGMLDEIRAEGFDGETAPLMAEAEKEALAGELRLLGEKADYKAVRSSRNGLELTEFSPEDLVFSGFDFLSLQPADLPGMPESEVMDNEDGTSLLRVDGDGYIAVFLIDADGTVSVVSLSIEDDTLEGPRCVRLGDAFYEDLQRFRFESREPDGITEVLYGGASAVPRGTVEYGGLDDITLRYVTGTPDGREAELLLRYTLSRLSEIYLYIR